jgi:hypothetical protein
MTSLRDLQYKKQNPPMNSTVDGMRIDFTIEERKKANISIRFRLHSLSNMTSLRESQLEKQYSPINSTVDGIRIDVSPE